MWAIERSKEKDAHGRERFLLHVVYDGPTVGRIYPVESYSAVRGELYGRTRLDPESVSDEDEDRPLDSPIVTKGQP
jgi:hypothetical protein